MGEEVNESPSTFWSAACTILEQVYSVLRPDGTAIWIVKDYVRDGQIVPFSQQWRTVCEHVGFVTLHEHHAMLVEEHGVQGGLFGEDTTHRTERKSFFRRLHEKKRPDLAIDHETVLCMRKPAAAAAMPPDKAWHQPALLDACVASPPWGESLESKDAAFQAIARPGRTNQHSDYGTTPGQLGAMPAGTPPEAPPC